MTTGRIEPLAFESLDSSSQALLLAGEQIMGFMPNDGLTMARVPGLLGAASELVAAVYRPGEVSMTTKRLVALMHSSAAGCVYCQSHARYGGLKQGLPEQKLDAIWSYETSAEFSEAERAALKLAHHSAMQPNQVSESDFEALRQHYTEDGIAEIVAVIALFGFLNRWNDTIGTEVEEAPASTSRTD